MPSCSRNMPTSRASASTATASPAQAASATPIAMPSQASVLTEIEPTWGTSAKPAANTRLRSTPSQETVERGPKQAQGVPALPRRIAPAVSAANSSISAEAA